MTTKKSLLATILLVLLLPVLSICQDWLIEDQDGTITLISGDLILIDDPNEGSYSNIFDLSERTLTVVSQQQQTYAAGSMDDYCEAFRSLTSAAMEAMPPEQREMMEAFLNESAEQPAPAVEIINTGEKDEVAGYPAVKYEVMADGELYEEVWLSKDDRLSGLIESIARMEPVTYEIVNCAAFEVNLQIDPEFSEAYRELMRTGMEMKSMRYEFGTPEPGTTLVRIERKHIPASEFSVPEGYARVTFEEFMRAQGTME